jgi:hypothetical protein
MASSTPDQRRRVEEGLENGGLCILDYLEGGIKE